MIGSTWNKWDLHIHSPKTNLNNQYGESSFEDFASKIIENELSLLGITNYWYFQPGELEAVRDALRAKNCSAKVMGNLEFRVTQSNKQGDWINVHCIFAEHVTTSQINDVMSKMRLLNTTVDGLGIYCTEADFKKHSVGFDDAIVEFEKLLGHMAANFLLGRDYLVAICPNGYGGYRADVKEGRSKAIATEIEKKGQVILARPQDRAYFLDVTRYQGAVAKPVFFCSDAHDLQRIGTQYSWVKAVPSFQGLKQVLFEPDDRIQLNDEYTEKGLIKPYFSSIEIEGAIFQGQDICFKRQVIPLNPNMVAIIGGRGTGKSLFLDAMHSRLAVCAGQEKVRQVSVDALKITVAQGTSQLQFNAESKTPYPYLHVSQGEIHDFAKDPAILSDEIKKMLGLKQPPFDPVLSEELTENMGRYRSFIDYWNAVDAHGMRINMPEYQQGVISSNTTLIETLTSPENSALIERFQSNSRVLNEQSNFLTVSRELSSAVERSVAILNDRITSYNLSEYATNKAPHLITADIQFAISSNISLLEGSVSELVKQNETIAKEFLDKGIRQDVSSLLSKIGEYQLGIDNANAKLVEIDARTALYFADQKRRSEIAAEYDVYLERLRSAIDMAFSKLLHPNASWNEEQNRLVREILNEISVTGVVTFNKEAFYTGLEQCLNRGKFRAAGNKTTFERLAETFNVHSKEDFIRLLMGHEIVSVDGKNLNIEAFFWKDEFFNQGGRFELFDYLYSPARIKGYLRVNAQFSYKGKSVDKLSVGQRGTFYVCLKLATDPFGSPFVFDQPEDDLDNSFIMGQLVPLFKKIKKYRQLIIVTHNANLVVNSDAEQVIVADNDGEVVSYIAGALEEGDVKRQSGIRFEVCSILEGGHEAFAKREQKYGISWS